MGSPLNKASASLTHPSQLDQRPQEETLTTVTCKQSNESAEKPRHEERSRELNC